jgi:hypothetical protein
MLVVVDEENHADGGCDNAEDVDDGGSTMIADEAEDHEDG